MMRIACVSLALGWLVACGGDAPGSPPAPTPTDPASIPPAPTPTDPASIPPAPTPTDPAPAPPANLPPGVPADADAVGPSDGDPTVIGDEIPAGGWAKDGVIYEAGGKPYGCTSGGNDCM